MSSNSGPLMRFNVRLVRTVEKYPNIYNYQLEEYSYRQKKQETWKLIAAEVGSTVPQCKEKWRNLRICYTEYLRKYPNDTLEQLNRRSYLTEVIQFLRPFIRTREDYIQMMPPFQEETCSDITNFSNIIRPKLENADETVIINDEDTIDDELMTIKYLENIQKEELDISPMEEMPNDYNTSTTALPDLVENKQKFNWVEANNSETSDTHTVLLNSNPRHQFLMSILPDLEKMTDRQVRKFRSRVSTAIEEILED